LRIDDVFFHDRQFSGTSSDSVVVVLQNRLMIIRNIHESWIRLLKYLFTFTFAGKLCYHSLQLVTVCVMVKTFARNLFRKLWLSLIRIRTRILFCPSFTPNDEVMLSRWMENLPQEVRKKPLLSLMIPGSHDSGSYGLKTSLGFAPDQGDLERAWWFRYFPRLTMKISKRWTKTQAADVTQQLVHGIRYFDLRGAPKIYQNQSNKDKFNATKLFFVHALYGPSLSKIVSKVSSFLDAHRKEFVILHFQHFHAVNEVIASRFLDELIRIFGHKMCPFSPKNAQSSLDDLLSKGHQVIVFFPSDSKIKSDKLWPPEYLPNPWANTTDIKSLAQFLDESMTKRSPDRFYVTQGVLTPDHPYIRDHFLSSLRKSLAEPCNKFLLDWIKNKEPGATGPNIVMSDFVDWNDYELPRQIIMKNFNV
jgi:hypothetical protein